MKFYDFPDAYDLIYTDQYYEDCKKFYKDTIGKKKYKDVLDCSIGTGQMALPLAMMGYNVTGTDINQNMLSKARSNFAQHKLPVTLSHCDFRKLSSKYKEQFDCVLCTGNSLGHVKNDDLESVITSMHEALRPGGMIFIDSKNWDKIVKRKQIFYLNNPIIRDRGRVNYVQFWDHKKDGSIIFFHLIFEEIDNKIVSKRQFYEVYYPFKSIGVIECLKSLNYQNINICKLGDTSQKDLEKIEWYAITAEKPIE